MSQTKWKGRWELPVLTKLEYEVDVDRIKAELETFSKDKIWDGLGSDYSSLCETHTRLPKMFFKAEEMEGVDCVCDLDWEHTSYQQLSITEFDESFDLDTRTDLSGSKWDKPIKKWPKGADERYYRKLKQDVPSYMEEVMQMFPNAHRSRFAALAPNSSIKPHIDYDTLYGVRIHIALDTNEGCINGGWDKDGNKIVHHIPADGSVWLVNPGVKHFAENAGNNVRTHWIISLDTQSLKGLC
jgi:hypothetical protein